MSDDGVDFVDDNVLPIGKSKHGKKNQQPRFRGSKEKRIQLVNSQNDNSDSKDEERKINEFADFINGLNLANQNGNLQLSSKDSNIQILYTIFEATKIIKSMDMTVECVNINCMFY